MSLQKISKNLRLEKDGKNLNNWLFKLRTVSEAESFSESFTYSWDPAVHLPIPGLVDPTRVSVLTNPASRLPFATLSPDQMLHAVGVRNNASAKR